MRGWRDKGMARCLGGRGTRGSKRGRSEEGANDFRRVKIIAEGEGAEVERGAELGRCDAVERKVEIKVGEACSGR